MSSAQPVVGSHGIPLPTLDRPFGIHLWPIFDKAWTAVVGYSADEFRFVPFETPMSTLKSTSIFIVIYYAIIFGGREWMRNREPFKLKTLFLIHNFYLTTISFILLVLFVEQLIPTVARQGIFHAICHREGGFTQPLVVLYYVSSFSLAPSRVAVVLLLTSASTAQLSHQVSRAFGHRLPLPQEEAAEYVPTDVLLHIPRTRANILAAFLHCYHHGATALLCYTQLIGSTSVSWVPIVLNLTVHVVMYWYYFQSARGIRIWWKEWVTRLQIIQFVIDLGTLPLLSAAARCASTLTLARFRLLCVVYLLHFDLLPVDAQLWQLRR